MDTIIAMVIDNEFRYGHFPKAEIGILKARALKDVKFTAMQELSYTKFGWARIKQLAKLHRNEGLGVVELSTAEKAA